MGNGFSCGLCKYRVQAILSWYFPPFLWVMRLALRSCSSTCLSFHHLPLVLMPFLFFFCCWFFSFVFPGNNSPKRNKSKKEARGRPTESRDAPTWKSRGDLHTSCQTSSTVFYWSFRILRLSYLHCFCFCWPCIKTECCRRKSCVNLLLLLSHSSRR